MQVEATIKFNIMNFYECEIKTHNQQIIANVIANGYDEYNSNDKFSLKVDVKKTDEIKSVILTINKSNVDNQHYIIIAIIYM